MREGRWTRVKDIAKFDGHLSKFFSVKADLEETSRSLAEVEKHPNSRWRVIFSPQTLDEGRRLQAAIERPPSRWQLS